MICPHCSEDTRSIPDPEILPSCRPLEGGKAYAYLCSVCGGVVGLRPRLSTDPAPVPAELTQAQIDRLRFVRWRLEQDCHQQIQGDDSPWSAA